MSKAKPLSGTQQWALDWLRAQPSGCDRRAYRRAGITTGTMASLVGQGLVEPLRNDDSGAYTWRVAIAEAGNDSLVGLGKSDVAGFAVDVDQGIPVIASGAQEENPVAVNLGLDRSEHDFEATASALPHGCAPVECGNRTARDGVLVSAQQTPAPLELVAGRTYRAKRPASAGDFGKPLVNDRTVVYVGLDTIQYDGPSVAFGRRLPKVSPEAFRKWAARDVTNELPKDEYAPWPIAKATERTA